MAAERPTGESAPPAHTDRLVAVILAAGLGTRLRPLTEHLPKALCPVGGVPLVDHAISHVRPLTEDVAVNVFSGRSMMEEHLAGRVHMSIEEGREPLGTAGGIGALREWIRRRDVLVVNADAWFTADLGPFVDGWNGERHRLLCVHDPDHADFGALRYVGVSLLPAHEAARLEAVPSGLYETCWAGAVRAGRVDLVQTEATFHDCGTPARYLAANLAWSGGESVVGPGADVRGEVVRSLVWPGGVVREDERLVDEIRVGETLTVPAAPAAPAAPGAVQREGPC